MKQNSFAFGSRVSRYATGCHVIRRGTCSLFYSNKQHEKRDIFAWTLRKMITMAVLVAFIFNLVIMFTGKCVVDIFSLFLSSSRKVDTYSSCV